MFLTENQSDALTEVINIAFSRAAASLSELTNHRVLLEVPKVSIHPIHELKDCLGEFVHEEIATVHQIFTGAQAFIQKPFLISTLAERLKEVLEGRTTIAAPVK